MSKWDVLAYKDYQANPWNYVLDFKFGKGPTITLLYMNSTGNNWFGLSKLKNPFSKGNIGGPKGQAAMTAIGEGINLAGTALNKGVTNETGEILTTAGSGLMSIPTPYTKAIGVGLIGAGVVANGLTDRVNTKYLNAKNAEVNRIGNWTSLAGDYRGLQQEMSNFNTVDLGDLENWGDVGFLSSGNKVRGARSTTERALLAATGMRQLGVNSRGQYINMMNTYNLLGNLTALGGALDNVDPSTPIGYSIYTDKTFRDRLKDSSGMTNMFAGTPSIFGFGGGIFTKGANFDTGVSFINKGGTHEENPNDGVQMGVDSQGVPNLVEEGEVNWEDYIFSDRLIVPRGKRGNYGKRARKYAEGGKLAKGKGIDTPYESLVLKPYEGLTFAEAAKKIVKKNGADERHDAITMRGVNAQLSVLAGILEKEREKEKLREMLETIDNMSPEEFAMLQQLMEAQLAALQLQEMAMLQQLMIPLGMELMQPVEQQQPIAALGGLLNTWDVQSPTTEDINKYDVGGNLNTPLYNEWRQHVFGDMLLSPNLDNRLQMWYGSPDPDLRDLSVIMKENFSPESYEAIYNSLAPQLRELLESDSFDDGIPQDKWPDPYRQYREMLNAKSDYEKWNRRVLGGILVDPTLSGKLQSWYDNDLEIGTLSDILKQNFNPQVYEAITGTLPEDLILLIENGLYDSIKPEEWSDAYKLYLDTKNANTFNTGGDTKEGNDVRGTLYTDEQNKRIDTIVRLYNRRLKKLGIDAEKFKGRSLIQYRRELNTAIEKGLEDESYDVSKDTELMVNDPRVTNASNKQTAYGLESDYRDLIASGGFSPTLDENGKPMWKSMQGLNRIDNSGEGFYDNPGIYEDVERERRGIYDYGEKERYSTDADDFNNIKLYGWKRGEDGNYVVDKSIVNPNENSKKAGKSNSTYKISDLGTKEDGDYLTYGLEGYKEALTNILGNADYDAQTDEMIKALRNDDGTLKNFKDLPKRILNHLKYLDANTANTEDKLLIKDAEGNIQLNPGKGEEHTDDAVSLYERRRYDDKYGIYHYLYGKENVPLATRYYYMDNGKPVYILKPSDDFTISGSPTVNVVGGTTFNDYEVTGLNKKRTLTLLPDGRIVDVTNVPGMSNWKKLNDPVVEDNKDNLGYGITGDTDWVDYGSGPTLSKLKKKSDEDYFPKAENWPYLFGAVLLSGALGYNILKPADYSNANALLNAAKEAGTYTPISPLFAGQRLPYKPAPDTKFGKIIGVGLGNAKNIINNSRGNIGATQAGLLQNALNTQLALGEADEAWRQGNWNMFKDVLTFGLQRDTSNYDRDLKAKMSNLDAASRAAGYTLEGKRAAYAMRQAIDDAKANAISAGISGLGNLAMAYGLNKWNQDILGWKLRHNQYPISLLEGYKYDPYTGKPVTASKGGKLRTRRKRSLSF